MSGRLQGKVVIVTGGESGIGAAVLARFKGQGAIAISADRVVGTAALMPDGGCHPLDVAQEASVQALIGAVVETYGRLDSLVNCAGVGADCAALDTSVELFDRVIGVNLRGSFLAAREAAKAMAVSGGGSIVLIGSVSGRRGNVGRAAYGASKGGIVTLAEVTAVEWAPLGIRVNVIAPGPIDSPMAREFHTPEVRAAWYAQVPMGRYGSPEEIADAALFLAGPESTYVTGHVLHVDGGFLAGGMMPRRRE